ncbi:MAG TPA: transposase family protein [bacterium]|nr:transposase family protein [bacterium]
MANTELFALALGFTAPWYVQDITFDAEAHRLDLDIDFHAGSKFTCPSCKRLGCGVHDTQKRTWLHLDFFQHQAYITARVPRTQTSAYGLSTARSFLIVII